ncbi:unnamed protein product [Closterium sp. NIES-65]|nr:unnamed protein product [Closterium sp. NIES-65]
MIHAAAPHFLWPFAVQYAVHQLNLWPRVSLPETSPTLRWTGEVGDASAVRVWGSRAFVPDTSADKLSAHAIPCVFLGSFLDAPSWQFYHSTMRRVLHSQDVTFDESVPLYRLFPYRTAPLPPPPLPLFLAPGPPPADLLPPQGPAPSGVSQVDPLPLAEPVEVAVDSGAAGGGAASGGAEPECAEPGGAELERVELGGAEPGVAEFENPLSPLQLREWFARRTRLQSGAAEAGGAAAGDTAAGGTGARGARAAGPGGAGSLAGAGGTGGAGAASPGGAVLEVLELPELVVLLVLEVLVVLLEVEVPEVLELLNLEVLVLEVLELPELVVLLVLEVLEVLELLEPLEVVELLDPEVLVHEVLELLELVVLHALELEILELQALELETLELEVLALGVLELPEPESDLVCAASPTVTRLLANVVTDPSFESTAASALVTELVDFAAACRLDYAASLVAESESDYPPCVGGECALGTDVLEDRQEDFECLAATVPHLVAMLLAPEGDPDAPDIPTPRSYAEAITDPYSSQWQTAMDAAMVSSKSTGTYIDAVPPSWGEQCRWHVDFQGEAVVGSSTFLQGSLRRTML